MTYYLLTNKNEKSPNQTKLVTGLNEGLIYVYERDQLPFFTRNDYWLREVTLVGFSKTRPISSVAGSPLRICTGIEVENFILGERIDLLSLKALNILNWPATHNMVETAIERGRPDFIDELKAHKHEAKHNFGIESVKSAIEKYIPQALELYIAFGVDINTPFNYKADTFTPLHMAVYLKRYTLVKILIKAGCKTDIAAGEQEFTPLGMACFYGYEFMVDLLLVYGLDPNVLNGGKRFKATPLHLCIFGMEPNDKSDYPRDLHLLIKLLLEFKADLTVKSWEGLSFPEKVDQFILKDTHLRDEIDKLLKSTEKSFFSW